MISLKYKAMLKRTMTDIMLPRFNHAELTVFFTAYWAYERIGGIKGFMLWLAILTVGTLVTTVVKLKTKISTPKTTPAPAGAPKNVEQ